jgi:hypothetical protein
VAKGEEDMGEGLKKLGQRWVALNLTHSYHKGQDPKGRRNNAKISK